MSDYERIEKAIEYLVQHATEQPNLDAVAKHIDLSPHHFHRLFSRWAGTTPKRFLQVITLEQGKKLLMQSRSQLEVSHTLGLSSGSRLHDHFVQLEAMTPGEFKQQGSGVIIDYGVHETPFGDLLLAMTERGICRASFIDSALIEPELIKLQSAWPLSTLQHNPSRTTQVANQMFDMQQQSEVSVTANLNLKPFNLQVLGTNFQVAVWRALLNIPSGTLVSYSELAQTLGCPKASRAVANAIGANPVAYLIPCHRVIRESGALGGYRWGVDRKQVIQTWERLQINVHIDEA